MAQGATGLYTDFTQRRRGAKREKGTTVTEFGEELIKTGITRVVNGLAED